MRKERGEERRGGGETGKDIEERRETGEGGGERGEKGEVGKEEKGMGR